jgi:hypothetical protein
VQKNVFNGINSGNGAKCPHCLRPVVFYSYAFCATHKHASRLQDRLSSLESEVSGLKKSLVAASAEADETISRLNKWRSWGVATKDKISSMPPSSLPCVHVVVSPEPQPQGARSRSPRQTVRAARIV